MNRRGFLRGSAATALTLGASRLLRLAHGTPRTAPTRLLIVFKPNGTVPASYDCTGDGTTYRLSPILEPFAALREHMVVVDGLDIKKQPNTPGEDHGNGIVTFMTGGTTYKPVAPAIAMAQRPSIDQLLAHLPSFTGDTPIESLLVAADTRSTDMFTRILSYAGRGQPLASEQRPFATYVRLFGALADPGTTPEQLARARLRQQSVLDFSRAGLARIAPQLGAEGRARLERHAAAIREVERVLDRARGVADLPLLEAELRGVDPERVDEQHAAIGRAQLDLVRAAFQCDLTRIATFAWASGQSFVNFSKLIPGVEDMGFHPLTHQGMHRDDDETVVHRWYNEQLASFIATLARTPDFDGNSLLDNTLIVVWSEVRLGIHTFDGVPIQLFGGAGGRLRGGRRLVYDHRSTNDLWLAIANTLGHPMACFGDAERCAGPLPDLFAPPLAGRASPLADPG